MPTSAPPLRGKHIYDHLGVWSRRLSEETAETLMPITADIRIAGGVRAAPLGLAFEQGVGTYLFGKALAVPAQISLHIRDHADGVDEIRSTTRFVRVGRSIIVTDGEIRDSADEKRLIAYGSIIWAAIGEAPGLGQPSERPGHTPAGFDVLDSAGIEPIPDSAGVRLDGLTPQTLGPGGILHAGMYQLMCEEAALRAGRAALGTDRVVAADCTYDFLQPGKVGPFNANPELLHVGSDSVDARVTVRDEGSDNRPVCVAWVRAVSV